MSAKYACIAAHRDTYAVRLMCRVLAVHPAGFYRAQAHPVSARAARDDELAVQLHMLHHTSRGTYGAPRLYQALQQAGEPAGRHRIARVMRAEGLVGQHQRRWRRAPSPVLGPHPAATPLANVLQRQFAPSASLNRAWVADFTQLRYGGARATQRATLAVVLDVASRAVIGWQVAAREDGALVTAALTQALYTRRPAPGFVHHSDRGVQYTSLAYQQQLTQHGAVVSLSAKGDCYDNAVVESFFATLKRECDLATCPTLATLRAALFDYLEIFYNRERLHSTLAYQAPLPYEKQLDHEGRAA